MPLSFLKRTYQKKLIPTPALFGKGSVGPFINTPPRDKSSLSQIYYATERQKSNDVRFYNSKRDQVLHLGKASVSLGPEGITWEEIARQTLQQKRGCDMVVAVKDIHEFGHLWTASSNDEPQKEKERQQSALFAEDINQKLKRSQKKDIYIFVPGFRVCFEDPLLVAKQFWHYLGYDGVFLAYCWPATPGLVTTYGHDVETTKYCSRNFRLLLEFLGTSTDVERIHIIGHSAGSRIVCSALNELRLKYSHQNEDQLRQSLKIGRVILIGADFDRMLLKSYYRDHILDLLQNVTIYVSRKDRVLKIAGLLFKTPRLGVNAKNDISPAALKVLQTDPKINIIDTSFAPGVNQEGGHMYLLTSPWVSSDMILLLQHGHNPARRNLQPREEGLYWGFGKDYGTKITVPSDSKKD